MKTTLSITAIVLFMILITNNKEISAASNGYSKKYEPKNNKAKIYKTINIGVFGAPEKNSHFATIFQILEEKLKGCKICKLKAYPVYNNKGELRLSQLKEVLSKYSKTTDIFLFTWNIPYTKKMSEAVSLINNIDKTHKYIVASSGENKRKGKLLKLYQTFMGKLNNIFLIGELDNKERLPMNAYYGKELFTALRPELDSKIKNLKNKKGSSYTAPLFVAALAKFINKFGSIKYDEIISRKKKSLKLYPPLNEVFPNK